MIKGDINVKKEYDDEKFMIIKDIEPKAKLHYLVIPKKHYKLIKDMNDQDRDDFNYILKKLPTLVDRLGLTDGFRIIINQGDDANQTVPHLHIHLLGGQKLSEF